MEGKAWGCHPLRTHLGRGRRPSGTLGACGLPKPSREAGMSFCCFPNGLGASALNPVLKASAPSDHL